MFDPDRCREGEEEETGWVVIAKGSSGRYDLKEEPLQAGPTSLKLPTSQERDALLEIGSREVSI